MKAALPSPVVVHVRVQIERIFGSRGDEAVAAALATVPREAETDATTTLCQGGPFGWWIRARPESDGSVLLCTDSRMHSGPTLERVDAGGEVVVLRPAADDPYGYRLAAAHGF